jgi:Flp pilus assembly protein TadG
VTKLRKLPRNQRGNALIEFAIGTGVLVSVFAGTFQWGYTFFRYNALLQAVTSGARLAAYRSYDSATTTPSAAFQLAVKNQVVYGNPAGGTTPVVPGLTTSNVVVNAEFPLGAPAFVNVYISSYQLPAIFGTTTLVNKPKVRVPYQGIYAPF